MGTFKCPQCGGEIEIQGNLETKKFQEFAWDGSTDYVQTGDYVEDGGPASDVFHITDISCPCGFGVPIEDIENEGAVTGTEETLRATVESLIDETAKKYGVEFDANVNGC